MRRMRKLEWLLLAFGVSMFGFYVAARIHGIILSRAEIERFKSQWLLASELDSREGGTGKIAEFQSLVRKTYSGLSAEFG